MQLIVALIVGIAILVLGRFITEAVVDTAVTIYYPAYVASMHDTALTISGTFAGLMIAAIGRFGK